MWCCAVLAVEEYVEGIVAYVMSGCCLVMGSSKVVEMRGPGGADERESDLGSRTSVQRYNGQGIAKGGML